MHVACSYASCATHGHVHPQSHIEARQSHHSKQSQKILALEQTSHCLSHVVYWAPEMFSGVQSMSQTFRCTVGYYSAPLHPALECITLRVLSLPLLT